MTPADDPVLLAAAALGDAAAFHRFVERHQDAVFRFLRWSAADPDDAEDALQETFLAAWRGAGGYRGDASARAWVLAIARNALHRHYRRSVGEPAHFEDVDAMAQLPELGRAAGWGQPDVLERLARRELLEAALASLDPADREILVLRELEELSGAAVADALDLTVAAMKSRLHRARLRLAAALRGMEG